MRSWNRNTNKVAAKKKPPACDACKARRVLCHNSPLSSNLPCPRCAEKGIICKTTPVQRGRPRKTLSEDSQPSASGSTMATLRRNEVSETPQLPVELVKDLMDCTFSSPESFTSRSQCYYCLGCAHVGECRIPLFHGEKLKATLAAASWQLHLLPPQLRVLATCACALAATISFNPAVIGPGPQPSSFADRSVFFRGSDLRIYGVRRAAFCRALYEQAVDIACDCRIHLEVSEENAASCFFLDVLERLNDTVNSSRAWAVAYMSHLRILLGSSDAILDGRRSGIWSGFQLSEALKAVAQRMPVLVTRVDQLLVARSEPPSLEQLFDSLHAMREPPNKSNKLVFPSVQPYMFHVTRLARELCENITGDYARRRPFPHTAAINFLSSLSILQSIATLVLDQLEFFPDAELLFFDLNGSKRTTRSENENLRACGFVVACGFAALVLALYREMKYRIATEAHTTEDRWLRERIEVFGRQVHEMTSGAVGVVAQAIKLLPSLPHLAQVAWIGLQDWAEFRLIEASGRTADASDVAVFESITPRSLISAFKMSGYSWDVSGASELIEQMERYIMQHNLKASASFSTPSGFSEVFSLDETWPGMFAADPSGMVFYDSADPPVV
ncbi:hypothetical protein B0H16DRAFT_1883483 [Mycena metata]|uniref:Zn(2)-C6 fungal-type domain-containing protein n=1 Tax=Mycena metata TaxID=1033252 RepID=A0AAD7NJZ0_9AGAR|nr:hypothetical protein B0H16DRAFT_1883483 [Mycena metata]